MRVIVVSNNDDNRYVFVVDNKRFYLVKDMQDATLFGAMCDSYIDSIIEYLHSLFPEYRFNVLNVSSLGIEISHPNNIFDRESFNVKL